MWPVNKRLFTAWLVSLCALVLVVISIPCPWYYYNQTGRSGTVTEFLFFANFEHNSCSYVSGDSCVGSNVRAMYAVIAAMAFLSLVLLILQFSALSLFAFKISVCLVFPCPPCPLCFSFMLIQVLLLLRFFWSHRQVVWKLKLRRTLGILAVISFLATVTTWTIIFCRPEAARSDNGGLSMECKVGNQFCEPVGSGFGMHAGWGISVCSSFFAFLAVLLVPFKAAPQEEGYTALVTLIPSV